jgi:hypothetical protein
MLNWIGHFGAREDKAEEQYWLYTKTNYFQINTFQTTLLDHLNNKHYTEESPSVLMTELLYHKRYYIIYS